MRPVVEAKSNENLPDVDISGMSKEELEALLNVILRYSPQDPVRRQIYKRLQELTNPE